MLKVVRNLYLQDILTHAARAFFWHTAQGLRPIRKAMVVNQCYPSKFPLDHRLGIFEIPRMQNTRRQYPGRVGTTTLLAMI